MTTRERISALESRQLELRAIMADSDAHASICQKLGLSFAENYPDELDAYRKANDAFNVHETELAELYAQLKREEEEERHPEPEVSNE